MQTMNDSRRAGKGWRAGGPLIQRVGALSWSGGYTFGQGDCCMCVETMSRTVQRTRAWRPAPARESPGAINTARARAPMSSFLGSVDAAQRCPRDGVLCSGLRFSRVFGASGLVQVACIAGLARWQPREAMRYRTQPRDEQATDLPELRPPSGFQSRRRVPPTLSDGSIAPRAWKERDQFMMAQRQEDNFDRARGLSPWSALDPCRRCALPGSCRRPS